MVKQTEHNTKWLSRQNTIQNLISIYQINSPLQYMIAYQPIASLTGIYRLLITNI